MSSSITGGKAIVTDGARVPALRLAAEVVATLGIPSGSRSFGTAASLALSVTLEGIAGDRHGGWVRKADARTPHHPRGTPIRNMRHVSILSVEELAEIAATLGVAAVSAESMGANLLIEGLPHLSRLPRGSRLAFPGGTSLLCEGYNPPCIKTGKSVAAETGCMPQAFVTAAQGRRGIVATVDRAGEIAPGDAISIFIPEQWFYPAPVESVRRGRARSTSRTP